MQPSPPSSAAGKSDAASGCDADDTATSSSAEQQRHSRQQNTGAAAKASPCTQPVLQFPIVRTGNRCQQSIWPLLELCSCYTLLHRAELSIAVYFMFLYNRPKPVSSFFSLQSLE